MRLALFELETKFIVGKRKCENIDHDRAIRLFAMRLLGRIVPPSKRVIIWMIFFVIDQHAYYVARLVSSKSEPVVHGANFLLRMGSTGVSR